jgi:hypothetical protein
MIASRRISGTRTAAASGADDRRLRAWYEALPRIAQEAPYSLHDVHDATGITLARLPALLWRAGWFLVQPSRYPDVRVWYGPISTGEPPQPPPWSTDMNARSL